MITLDPQARDRLADDYGEALEACGPTRKALQLATGHSKTHIHNMVHGDRSGVMRDAYRLEKGRQRFRTTAMPLIGRMLAVALEARRDSHSADDLGQRILEGMLKETDAQAGEDRHQQRLAQTLAPLLFQGAAGLTLPQRRHLRESLAQYIVACQEEIDRQLDVLADVRLLSERID